MLIFAGFAGRQMKVASGVVENGDFRYFARYILRIFTLEATFIILCYVAH